MSWLKGISFARYAAAMPADGTPVCDIVSLIIEPTILANPSQSGNDFPLPPRLSDSSQTL